MTIRLVSVIVITYNRTALLSQNIQALLNQTLDKDVKMEIIIVDDCSTQENKDKSLFIANQFEQVRIVFNSINKGRSGSRNIGASYANGEYLLFLDDDIIVDTFYVMGHLSILASHARVATVGSLQFPPELTSRNNLMKYLSSRELRQRKLDSVFLNDLPPQYFGSGICGLRTSDFLKVGGFNESFTFYGGEDIQFGYLLKRAGICIRYSSEAQANHYDTVNFDRYRLKFMEAGREGVRLILNTDSHFFDNLTMRFLLPSTKTEPIVEKVKKFAVHIFLNKWTELIIRIIAKLTNHYHFLYSKYIYHVLFACWIRAGLREDISKEKSKVNYSN